VIASVVHFRKVPLAMVGSALLWSVLILLVAFLMISTVRYASFKEFDVRKPRPRMVFAAAAMVIALTIFYSEEVLLILAVIYVSSGPIAKLVLIVRRLLPAHTAASETAHDSIKN
jgi:CDP-diacylglycerol--serine O-phosphatidyltransferase